MFNLAVIYKSDKQNYCNSLRVYYINVLNQNVTNTIVADIVSILSDKLNALLLKRYNYLFRRASITPI